MDFCKSDCCLCGQELQRKPMNKQDTCCSECLGGGQIAECFRCHARLVLATEAREHREDPGQWWRHIHYGDQRVCSVRYPTNEVKDVRPCPCTTDDCACVACRQRHDCGEHASDCGVHAVGNNPLAWKQSDCTCLRWPSTSALGCEKPPEGWSCSREEGHAGPCAASEASPSSHAGPPVAVLASCPDWSLSIVLYPSGPCLEMVQTILDGSGSRTVYSEPLANLVRVIEALKGRQ